MSARDDVLARVRGAQSGLDRPIPREYRPVGALSVDLDLFVERLIDYRANVYRCAPDEIATTIAGRLDATARVLAPAGVPREWMAGLLVLSDEPALSIEDLDGADAVVTTCAVGVVETGTLVLDHGAGQGRRALTLVPDHHIVVIRADQVVASVPDAIAALPIGATQTWISGPSATSDIELNRVEGVHGPRRLDVLLV